MNKFEKTIGHGLRHWAGELDEHSEVEVRAVLAAATGQLFKRQGLRKTATDLRDLAQCLECTARRRAN